METKNLSTSSRILLADDHAIFRAGIRALLGEQPGIEVVGEADNGRDAVHKTRELKPDLVLLDISMPKTNGTEAVRDIKQRHPNVKVLILTVHKAEEYIHAALDAGADGYVLKDDSQDELIMAVQSLLSSKSYLSPSVCSNVMRGYVGGNGDGSRGTSWGLLTNREREVLKLVAEGYRNKDIAEYLSISCKTVEKHRYNMMKKLDLHSTSAVTAYAIEHSLIA